MLMNQRQMLAHNADLKADAKNGPKVKFPEYVRIRRRILEAAIKDAENRTMPVGKFIEQCLEDWWANARLIERTNRLQQATVKGSDPYIYNFEHDATRF